MANKVAFALVFSLMLVISCRTAVGTSDVTFDQGFKNFKKSADGAGDSFAHSASNAAEAVKDTAKSWTDWVKDKFD